MTSAVGSLGIGTLGQSLTTSHLAMGRLCPHTRASPRQLKDQQPHADKHHQQQNMGPINAHTGSPAAAIQNAAILETAHLRPRLARSAGVYRNAARWLRHISRKFTQFLNPDQPSLGVMPKNRSYRTRISHASSRRKPPYKQPQLRRHPRCRSALGGSGGHSRVGSCHRPRTKNQT